MIPSIPSNPGTSVVVFQGKRAPDNNYSHLYTAHTEPMMTYTDDARPASLKVTCHHGLRVREQMAGDGWWEMDRLIASHAYEPWTIKNKI